jgi:hypothetical protein
VTYRYNIFCWWLGIEKIIDIGGLLHYLCPRFQMLGLPNRTDIWDLPNRTDIRSKSKVIGQQMLFFFTPVALTLFTIFQAGKEAL